jgi:hypothetical protein
MGRILDTLKLKHWREHPDEFWKVLSRNRHHTLTEKESIFWRDMADLDINRIMMCSGSGTGKTYNLGALALWSPICLPPFLGRRYDVIICSGSLPQSQKLYEFTREFLESDPLIEDQVVGDTTKTRVDFKHGSVKALPASDKQLYSTHADLLIIDEAVEAGDKVLKHMYRIPATSELSRIVLSSTPHTPEDGTLSDFVDMWENVGNKYPDYVPGSGGWKRYTASWADCHWITDEEIEEARAGMSEERFQILCMGIPQPVVGTYFNTDDIRDKVRVEGNKPDIPLDEGVVSIGVDWGFQHPTVINIVHITDSQVTQIHEEGKEGVRFTEWNDRISELYDYYYQRYPTYVLADSSHIGENQRLRHEYNIPLRAVKFKSAKGRMLENLRAMIEHGRIRIWEGYDSTLRQLARYVLGKKKDDDYVDALALACFQRTRFPRTVAPKSSENRKRRGRFYISVK